MNYAELIATSIAEATGSPKSMIPALKQVVLSSAINQGFKLEETDLLDEIPPAKAEKMLRDLLKNKARVVAMIDSFLPPGTPSIAAQGKMASQIEQAVKAMEQQGVAPVQLPQAKPARWAPLRMFQGKKERT